ANRRLTREHAIVGTPSYMAPEQLRLLAADHRTDIFLLGVLLYEVASGVHPFETSDATLTMARILVSDPRPLPIASADLDRVIRKCLQKAPEERYQSARDLGIDLERVRSSTRDASGGVPEVVGAARQKSRQAWRAWWRTHQIVMAIAYTVLIIAAGTGLRSGLVDSDALFATIVCAAVVAVMARLHLAFHDRLDPQTTDGRLRSL